MNEEPTTCALCQYPTARNVDLQVTMQNGHTSAITACPDCGMELGLHRNVFAVRLATDPASWLPVAWETGVRLH